MLFEKQNPSRLRAVWFHERLLALAGKFLKPCHRCRPAPSRRKDGFTPGLGKEPTTLTRSYESGIEANRVVGAGSVVKMVTTKMVTVKSPAIKPSTIETIVVTTSPIGPIITVAVAIVGATVVRTRSVIARSVKNRDRKGQPKDKMNTSARRRFSEERQSRDDQQEDNELFHIQFRRMNYEFDQRE
jgi:hypothetical protein